MKSRNILVLTIAMSISLVMGIGIGNVWIFLNPQSPPVVSQLDNIDDMTTWNPQLRGQKICTEISYNFVSFIDEDILSALEVAKRNTNAPVEFLENASGRQPEYVLCRHPSAVDLSVFWNEYYESREFVDEMNAILSTNE